MEMERGHGDQPGTDSAHEQDGGEHGEVAEMRDAGGRDDFRVGPGLEEERFGVKRKNFLRE